MSVWIFAHPLKEWNIFSLRCYNYFELNKMLWYIHNLYIHVISIISKYTAIVAIKLLCDCVRIQFWITVESKFFWLKLRSGTSMVFSTFPEITRWMIMFKTFFINWGQIRLDLGNQGRQAHFFFKVFEYELRRLI